MARIKNMLIVTGGSIDLEWARVWLSRVQKEEGSFDFCMAADSGLTAADALGLNIDYLLGDYDSVNAEVLAKYRNSVENVMFPREKDYTDTELAVKTALELLQCNEEYRNNGRNTDTQAKVTIIGATGTRMDHTFANIGLLLQFAHAGIECVMIDRHNRIRLLDGECVCKIEKLHQYGRYVSCLPYTEIVSGLTLEGFKYPLDNYTLTQGISLCISNEITEDEAVIRMSSGSLMVFETRD